MQVKKTILMVDDNKLLAEAIQCLLEEYGHEVSCCHNGSDAVALAKKQNFDVLITDYNIPGIKGDAVCRLLRRHRADLLIIGCSIENQDKVFLNAGADTFIVKDQLVQNLAHLVQSGTTH